MILKKLPLDSPRWLELEACWSVEGLVGGLGRMAAARSLEGWALLKDEVLHQGTVYPATYAAVPHVVELAAASVKPTALVDLWTDLGLVVAAPHAHGYVLPVPADLVAGWEAALGVAERLAVQSFLDTNTEDPAAVSWHALACVALAGHPAGAAIWPRFDDTVVAVVCPGCGGENEIDGLSDPGRPSFAAPPEGAGARADHPWSAVAQRVDDLRRVAWLGEGWHEFLRVAAGVAAAGVPASAPARSVLCLVAAMVAAAGHRVWARKLMRLTGHFRCDDCAQVWLVADGLQLGESPDVLQPADPSTVVSLEPAGRYDLPPAGPVREPVPAGPVVTVGVAPDGRSLTMTGADGASRPWGRLMVLADSSPAYADGVNAVAVLARPNGGGLLAGGGDGRVIRLWDLATGQRVCDPLIGLSDRVWSMAAVPAAGGRTFLAAGGDAGTIAVVDPATGRPVGVTGGAHPGGVTALAVLPTPDGPMLLAAGDDGVVWLYDPATGRPAGPPLNRPGGSVRSMAVLPAPDGRTLVATAHGRREIRLWDPRLREAETGVLGAPAEWTLQGVGHVLVAAIAPVSLRDRTLLAVGDDNGLISLWDPGTGKLVGNPLPRDAENNTLTALTAITLPDGRAVLVAGSSRGRHLRLWAPAGDEVWTVALDVAVTALTGSGACLAVGHNCGLLTVTLADTARPAAPVPR